MRRGGSSNRSSRGTPDGPRPAGTAGQELCRARFRRRGRSRPRWISGSSRPRTSFGSWSMSTRPSPTTPVIWVGPYHHAEALGGWAIGKRPSTPFSRHHPSPPCVASGAGSRPLSARIRGHLHRTGLCPWPAGGRGRISPSGTSASSLRIPANSTALLASLLTPVARGTRTSSLRNMVIKRSQFCGKRSRRVIRMSNTYNRTPILSPYGHVQTFRDLLTEF